MYSSLRNTTLRLGGAALLAAGAMACHRTAASNADHGFCLNDTMARMIQIDTVHPSQVLGELRLSGKVGFDEDKVLQIYPFAGGTAVEVRVDLGDSVHKGEVLAVVRSGEIAGYMQDRVNAASNLILAQKNLNAAADLYRAGVESERDYVAAQKDLEKAQAERKRVAAIYALYDIVPGNSDTYVIKSPMDGFVVDKKITREMHIRADRTDNLFTISDLHDVWINANVFEGDIPKVRAGQTAEVTTLGYPDRVFHGVVDKVFNVLDPDSKTMRARIRLPNPGYLLKPDMYAAVTVHFSENRSLPAVASSALIFDQGREFVVVYRGACDLQARPVEIYRTVGDRAFITSGLGDGERVVARQALLVYGALGG